MLPWMCIYDNDLYGCLLPDFIAVLESLPHVQEQFMKSGMFAQSITGKLYSFVALGIWIKSTMNKGSKLKSGWLAILKNEKQLLSNTRNVNNVKQVRISPPMKHCTIIHAPMQKLTQFCSHYMVNCNQKDIQRQ